MLEVSITSFAEELVKLAKEKKKKKKGSLAKAVGIGAGAALGINVLKGLAEKSIEPAVQRKVKKILRKKGPRTKVIRWLAKRAPWAAARGLTGAAASVGYTLATLKAVQAATGK
jgi:phosphoenolpyruvate synthase/pyruvate phosphate dikinase